MKIEAPKVVPHLLGENGPLGSGAEQLLFEHNTVRGFDLDHRLAVVVRDNFLSDGSKTNQCIIAATRGASTYDFCGPVVLLRQRLDREAEKKDGKDQIKFVDIAPGVSVPAPPVIDTAYFEDIKLEDLRHVVDYFTIYPKQHKPRKIPGAQNYWFEGRNRTAA